MLFSSLGGFHVANADQATAQQKSLAFIENALPVDLSAYNVSFVKYSTLDGSVGNLKYTLASSESSFDVLFTVVNNVVRDCHVYATNGSVIRDRLYPTLLDAVKSFLEKYQTYSKIDSSNLIAILDNVDITKNTTITVGNIKLTITNNVWGGLELTNFDWAYTVNAADYTSLQVGFQTNGIFDAFYDNRAIYTIGNTSIMISSEQAIDIALQNLSTYSYKMPDQSTVSDFNVTKDKIVTTLVTMPVNSELRPYWDIRMPLNQTYPGSVQGITAFIWANTGEIISYGNIAFGGVLYSDSSGSNSTVNPTPTISPIDSKTAIPTLLPTTSLSPTSDDNSQGGALNTLPLILGIVAFGIAAAFFGLYLINYLRRTKN
jgi:hypothetical protein